VGGVSPASRLSAVDLPHPEGPRKVTNSRPRTSRARSSRTTFAPKRLVRRNARLVIKLSLSRKKISSPVEMASQRGPATDALRREWRRGPYRHGKSIRLARVLRAWSERLCKRGCGGPHRQARMRYRGPAGRSGPSCALRDQRGRRNLL